MMVFFFGTLNFSFRAACELLLEAEADVDGADVGGRTPLLAAASMGHAHVVELLLFWGCYVDSIDAEGRTVLSVAAAQVRRPVSLFFFFSFVLYRPLSQRLSLSLSLSLERAGQRRGGAAAAGTRPGRSAPRQRRLDAAALRRLRGPRAGRRPAARRRRPRRRPGQRRPVAPPPRRPGLATFFFFFGVAQHFGQENGRQRNTTRCRISWKKVAFR